MNGQTINLEESFIARCKAVGGEAVVLKAGESLSALVHGHYPQAGRVISALPGVEGAESPVACDPHSLDGTDVAVVRGQFGVAENAAVWVEQDIPERALYFITEALVLVIPRGALVADMGQAYERIGDRDFPFGVFISGPSKTADIEQALVFGAHGPRSVLVVLREEAEA